MHPRRVFPVLLPAITALTLLLLPEQALAFRCGSRLVNEGDSAALVVANCGKPTEISKKSMLRPPVIWRYGHPMRVAGGDIETTVETWIYNLGPNQLMRKLTIEGGVVTEIDTLGYGYR